MVDIVVFGSVAFDSIKTPFGETNKTLGGSGTYASIAASFFSKPGIVSAVGSDFGTDNMDVLKKRKLQCLHKFHCLLMFCLFLQKVFLLNQMLHFQKQQYQPFTQLLLISFQHFSYFL